MYAHTQNKTLYGVRYGCGKPNGKTKQKVYCQKWVRSKKSQVKSGDHKRHTQGGTHARDKMRLARPRKMSTNKN